MKVALFVSCQVPEAGGSYTFESQLLDTLLELQADSRHTFILYVSGQEIPTYLSESSLQIVPCYLSTAEKIRLATFAIIAAILSKLRHPIERFSVKGWREQHLLRLLKINQIDLTLSLEPNFHTLEYPYITTIWDLQHKLQSYFPEVSADGEWDRREKFYTSMLGRAVCIITGTETGKAEIEKFYQIPAERIKVIPFFTPQFALTSAPLVDVASPVEDRDSIAKYHLPDRYLFYPAQFWPHKNHVGLLLAIKCLKEKYDLEFSLVLVGADKGYKSHVINKIEELDLSKQVYLLDFVPQVEMAPLYRHAFALIFMTFFGPDNFPPLEAMALGCPVIASNVSGAKEQLADAAILVDPRQPEAIALAIKSLVEDPILRQNTIESGLKRANQWTAKDYIKDVFVAIDDFEAIRCNWQ
jgi:glycosyltransferase involved in cell wall biosynthesis